MHDPAATDRPATRASATPGRVGTDELIGRLAAALQPVRPLAPPVARAITWLVLMALLVAALVAWRQAGPAFMVRNAHALGALESAAMLCTAVLAVVAAFHASVPGHSPAWTWAPLPPLACWLAASGAGCLAHGLGLGDAGHRLGESPRCFMFIVATSVPLALLLGWALRRSRPIAPLPVALLGALGVASLSAFALQFFHPFDTTVIDLAFHAAAVLTVVVAGSVVRRALA